MELKQETIDEIGRLLKSMNDSLDRSIQSLDRTIVMVKDMRIRLEARNQKKDA